MLAVDTYVIVRHREPFDRMLVAQSSVEGILLLTADPTVAHYPGSVRKV